MISSMIDNVIVLTYLLTILGIGIYYRSNSGSFKSYANVKSSARNNKLLLIATIFASSVGGGTTFGIAEKAFSSNICYTYALLLAIPIDLLIAKYIVPKIIHHYGAESVGDIMFSYYGLPGRFTAGISAVMISIGLLAAQINVSGHIFQYLLKIDYIHGVILSYGIVIIYTTIGGLRSVMFTNLIQFFAMIIAIPLVTIFGIYKIGLSNFITEIPYEKVLLNNNQMWLQTLTAALSFTVMNLYPSFIQRALISNNPRATTQAIYKKSLIYAVFLIFTTLNGIIAYILYPTQEASLALPYLIDQIMPAGLQGIIVVGLLAAVMSTADSDLNIISVTLVKDFFSPIFKIQNQQRLLLAARIINVLIGSVAIVVALSFKSVVDLVVFISGFWGPMILVPFTFALFRITTSVRAMLLTSLSGGISFLLWEYYLSNYFYIKGVFIGTIISLIVFAASLSKKLIQKLILPPSKA